MMHTFFMYWRQSLESFLDKFFEIKQTTRYFYLKLFIVFVVLNLLCYWLALLTAFPGHIYSEKSIEYILMGFPVGFLGALFDLLSLSVTLYIVQKALETKHRFSYIAYLSVDLIIAILATFWVLFVFMVSGWFVSLILAVPETLEARHILYQERVLDAIHDPMKKNSLKNIYFGVVMGGSALLPTIVHILMAIHAMFHSTLSHFSSSEVK